MFSVFKNIFSGREKSVIGIDFGSSSIKAVQIRKEKGVMVFVTYISLAIGAFVEKGHQGQVVKPSDEELFTVLSTLLQESNITTKNAVVAIPFYSSIVKLIDVPPLTDERLDKIIQFEAKRHIPIPLEDVLLEWWHVPRGLLQPEEQMLFESEVKPRANEGKLNRKTLIIAVMKNEIGKYKRVLNRTDLTIKNQEIELFSVSRATLYNSKAPTLVVDIGAGKTKFYLLDSGIPVRSYYINQGGETMTNAIAQAGNISFKVAEHKKTREGFDMEDKNLVRSMELVFDDIFSMVNDILTESENTYRKTIQKLIFTGGGAATKGLLEEAKKKFTVDVEIANPFALLQHNPVMSERLKEVGPEFSVAIGAAMNGLNL